MIAYCELKDVQNVLQKSDAKFGDKQLGADIVESAITGVSRWFQRRSSHHFYDANADAADLIGDTPATASNLALDVPSSPHRQGKQIFRNTRGTTRYPVTHAGQFCRVTLPKYGVESIDRLFVREFGGDGTDWVADTSKAEGRGEDYYLRTADENGFKRSYLYVNAGSLGAHEDFTELLEVDVTYGVDYQETAWDDVRRGIAQLAAAQVIVDDDVIAQVPSEGSLINAQTQYDQLVDLPMDRLGHLSDYLGRAVE